MNITTAITAAADYNIDILCLDAPDGHPEKYNKTYKGKNKILPGMLEALGFSVTTNNVNSNIHKRTFEPYNDQSPAVGSAEVPINIANVVFEKEHASEALDKYTFKISAEGNYGAAESSSHKQYKLNFFNDSLGQLNEMHIPDEILEPLDKEGFVYFIKLTYTLVLEMPRTKGQIQIGKETIDYETYFDISVDKTITKSDVISQGATHKIIPAFISPNYTGFIEDASGIIVLVKYNTPETGNIVVYYKFSKQIPRTEKVILNLSKLNITIENKR